jgi:hypothetical protein
MSNANAVASSLRATSLVSSTLAKADELQAPNVRVFCGPRLQKLVPTAVPKALTTTPGLVCPRRDFEPPRLRSDLTG